MSIPPTDTGGEALAIVVERLDRARHDVSHFACGKPSLDIYLHDTLARDEEQNTAVAYVLVDPNDPADLHRVIGYFTVNSFALSKKQARRRDQDKHLGNYDPVPAILIGRLALDTDFHGQGLGSILLVSALMRILSIRESLGISVVVVHALDDEAAAFYEHHGFTRFRDEPLHLYYPLKTFAAGLAIAPAELSSEGEDG